MTTTSTISINVEFGGGLELLFSNVRKHKVAVPATVPKDNSTSDESLSSLPDAPTESKPADVAFLMHYLRDKLLKERADLFMENGTARPGILVLVNDTDWELEGEAEYELKDSDEIVFISTLHGG